MHYNKGKSLLQLVLILTIIFTLTITGSAEEMGYVNSTDGLNLRTGPGTDYQAVTVIEYGGQLTLLDCTDGWIRCQYNGMDGYVSAEFVSFEAEKGQRVTPMQRTLTGNKIVDEATKYLGSPYVYGGTSPAGFDCSGFVYYVCTNLGYDMLRTAAQQSTQGEYVSKENLMPGDLVFFGSANNIHHAGIYVGDGMMIHSPQAGDVVKYTSIVSGYHGRTYYTARRLPPMDNLE